LLTNSFNLTAKMQNIIFTFKKVECASIGY